MAVAPSTVVLDYSADSQFNDFSLVTLQERYMLPGETSPQQAFARAAAAFADDEAHAQRVYDYVKKGWFMFATPLLSNGGSERGLPISCFLTAVDDSREAIAAHYEEVIWLSSMGGGMGSYWNLRSNGEKTSRGSESQGAIPFIAVDDRLVLAVHQGTTRRGSEAVYLDIEHPEVLEFIVGRKTNGGDQNRKFTNLHNAVNISDKFMHAVRDNLLWEFKSPKTGEVRGSIMARELWKLLIETRSQTGEPYFHYVDTSNRHMQPAQKAKGLKVQQSNLCVVGETEILTDQGYLPMAILENTEVSAWNGREFSEVTIRKTAEAADLVRVWFEDGAYIDCTPEHNFYLAGALDIPTPAVALKPGDYLQGSLCNTATALRWDLKSKYQKDAVTNWYVSGWTTFAGFEDHNRLGTFAHQSTTDEALRRLTAMSVDSEADEDGMVLRFEPKTINAGFVPQGADTSVKEYWLSGALEAAGSWMEYEGQNFLVIGSTDVDTIREMRLLALEIGLAPRVRLTDTMNAFMLHQHDVYKLAMYGAYTQDVGFVEPLDNAPVVADVHPLPYQAETFCATEPKRGRLTFNGYVTGNCTEIMLHTGKDHHGIDRTAVCCLSSVNLEMIDDWIDDPLFIEDLFRMLDNALQVFIDTAPDQMEKARYSAMMERSVGLGAFGLHSLFKQRNIAFGSPEARALNKRIFKYLRRKANEASLVLGAERGSPADMEGTGERFAHKLALAPNASSSIICVGRHSSGVSPATEPDCANAFLHKTLSGSFPVKDPYLKVLLTDLGQDTDEVWRSIIENEGSVQHLDFLDEHQKAVFATAPEIDQRVVVRLAADRAEDICQGQSINVFFQPDADANYLTQVHWYAWEWGCKSLYYLRSKTPSRAENTNTKVERRIVIGPPANDVLPPEDEVCFSCQG